MNQSCLHNGENDMLYAKKYKLFWKEKDWGSHKCPKLHSGSPDILCGNPVRISLLSYFQLVLLEVHLSQTHLPVAETTATMALDLIHDTYGNFYFVKGSAFQRLGLVSLVCSETEWSSAKSSKPGRSIAGGALTGKSTVLRKGWPLLLISRVRTIGLCHRHDLGFTETSLQGG